MTILNNPKLAKMWSNRNTHSSLVGMQNGITTLEDSLAVSYKAKHSLGVWSSNCVPRYLPNHVENICPHKNSHRDIYSSFIHNCQNVEATKRSFNRRRVNKLWYIQAMEYYSAIKRNELSSHRKMWRNLKGIFLSERHEYEQILWF